MESMEELRALEQKRVEIEAKVSELTSFLTAPGMPGLRGGLDDSEGFPLPNIDHYAVCQARHDLACLNTDYTALMKQIEEKLIELHSEIKVHVDREAPTDKGPAFAFVENVSEKSPAETAGLKPKDEIVQFGTLFINEGMNQLEIFKTLPNLVSRNENQLLQLTVKRDGKLMFVWLTPKRWAGDGLLGCKLVPTEL